MPDRLRDFLEAVFMLVTVVWLLWSGPVIWWIWQGMKRWEARQEGAAYLMQLMGGQYVDGFEIIPRPLMHLPPEEMAGALPEPLLPEPTTKEVEKS